MPFSTIKQIKKRERTHAKATILVVEDDRMANVCVKSMLHSFECVVDIAETGLQAVKMASENNYDLIFMDIGLPDIDGIEATRRIRLLDNKFKAEVPIVVLTAHAADSKRCKRTLQAGAQKIFNKPIQPLEIKSVLERYVHLCNWIEV